MITALGVIGCVPCVETSKYLFTPGMAPRTDQSQTPLAGDA